MPGWRLEFDLPGAHHSDLRAFRLGDPDSPERPGYGRGNLRDRASHRWAGRGHRDVDHRLRELRHHPELYYPAALYVLWRDLPNSPGSWMVARRALAQPPHLWRQCHSRCTPGIRPQQRAFEFGHIVRLHPGDGHDSDRDVT